MEGNSFAAFAEWYIVFILSLTIHEASHALAALWGGDDTAYRSGQVSLNPWPHIRREPFGTVLIPILTFFSLGWTLGWASAPYDPLWGKRHPLRLAAMSAAGPAGNFLLALAAFLAMKGLLAAGVFAAQDQVQFSSLVQVSEAHRDGLLAPLAPILSIALSLNFLLFLFNLLPLPPMDGSAILAGIFPRSIGYLFDLVKNDMVFSIAALLVAWRLFPSIFVPPFRVIVGLLG